MNKIHESRSCIFGSQQFLYPWFLVVHVSWVPSSSCISGFQQFLYRRLPAVPPSLVPSNSWIMVPSSSCIMVPSSSCIPCSQQFLNLWFPVIHVSQFPSSSRIPVVPVSLILRNFQIPGSQQFLFSWFQVVPVFLVPSSSCIPGSHFFCIPGSQQFLYPWFPEVPVSQVPSCSCIPGSQLFLYLWFQFLFYLQSLIVVQVWIRQYRGFVIVEYSKYIIYANILVGIRTPFFLFFPPDNPETPLCRAVQEFKEIGLEWIGLDRI